jgi:hypothetical protein
VALVLPKTEKKIEETTLPTQKAASEYFELKGTDSL